MAAEAPIKLFWYRKEPNFGDALSPLVVAHLAGRPVAWAHRGECELYAAGSLMTMIANAHAEPRHDGSRPVIWGSGMMAPVSSGFLANVRLALLRGPITATLLGQRAEGYGDPGLLAPEVLGEAPQRQDRIGVVPHLSKRGDPALVAALADDPRLVLIDVTAEDPLNVVRQIASCAYVFASSLHGMIVADAFGVPNTWLDPSGNHGAAALKFYDYAASVGRALPAPLSVDEIGAAIRAGLPETIGHAAGVSACRQALVEAFPAELRAGQGAFAATRATDGFGLRAEEARASGYEMKGLAR
ncbi:polysaccharide pyruvyl transferase family protein [Tropicimonas sediminicola]|uniref:Polysaccharide pyruvyl transferase n=1 Tax=Tropicimonas sediminicola TaxID=1031541 RepID=A0A239H084_9RHOB|nr:polysaccharide pyruvyl transferase family protein [Tropicimonas sediminicola]SNS74797.1 Polysaccharide pyruvyl transferase [Tropicimonas sediminicola]